MSVMSDFDFIKLPNAFHACKTGKEFEHCLICEQSLHASGVYLIEKAFRKGEPLYEYALCSHCHRQLSESLSRQSRKAIEDYFVRHVDFELRQIEMMAVAPDRFEPWIAECIISRKPIAPDDEYQMIAVCLGDFLVLGPSPFAITGAAMEDLYELLSAQTREELDRFTRDYLGLPPEMLRGPVDTCVLL
jgi:hypothetical protein